MDGSTYTKRMLAYLAAHEGCSATPRVQVVHVVMAVPPRAAASPGRRRSAIPTPSENVFGPVRAFFAEKGLEATFVHTVGQAAESIARQAEDGKFDMVVMGSSGHGEVLNLVLGSVATKVLAKSTVPVLLIR